MSIVSQPASAGKLDGLTSKQYYRGLNRRFEKRAKILRRFGYQYTLTEYNVAVFVYPYRGRRPLCVAASFLLHADNRAWFDRLAELLRRLAA